MAHTRGVGPDCLANLLRDSYLKFLLKDGARYNHTTTLKGGENNDTDLSIRGRAGVLDYGERRTVRARCRGGAAKGKPNFEKTCVTCHGPEGKGDGPIGLLLKPPAANFTSPESNKKAPAELLDIIQNGKPGTGMVAWKNQFSEAQMQDLLAYLLTLRK